jgi:hypothetical protein
VQPYAKRGLREQAAKFNLAVLGKSSILKGITSVSLLEDIFENSCWLIVKIRYLFILLQSYFCSNDDHKLTQFCNVVWRRFSFKKWKNHFEGIRVLCIIRYETSYCLTHLICKTRCYSFSKMLRFVNQYRTFHNWLRK